MRRPTFLTGITLVGILMAVWTIPTFSQDAVIPPEPPTAEPAVRFLLKRDGGRVGCSPNGQYLVFDRPGLDGFHDLWISRIDGSEQKPLSAPNPVIPAKQVGNPAFHPSGRWIVFQAVDPALATPLFARSRIYPLVTNPGAGFHSNLWLMSTDGQQAWPLTHVTSESGVLHPHFSPDGTQLLWVEMQDTKPKPFGTWKLKLADFRMTKNGPVLQHVRPLHFPQFSFVESHGFSPDGQTILFSAQPWNTKRWWELDIFSYDLKTGTLQNLTETDSPEWDEHAHFTPDGQRIVWMSSRETRQDWRLRWSGTHVRTDYWIMKRDGSEKRRLTFFNEPTSPSYLPGYVIASDLDIHPNGQQGIGFVQIHQNPMRPAALVTINLPPIAGTPLEP